MSRMVLAIVVVALCFGLHPVLVCCRVLPIPPPPPPPVWNSSSLSLAISSLLSSDREWSLLYVPVSARTVAEYTNDLNPWRGPWEPDWPEWPTKAPAAYTINTCIRNISHVQLLLLKQQQNTSDIPGSDSGSGCDGCVVSLYVSLWNVVHSVEDVSAGSNCSVECWGCTGPEFNSWPQPVDFDITSVYKCDQRLTRRGQQSFLDLSPAGVLLSPLVVPDMFTVSSESWWISANLFPVHLSQRRTTIRTQAQICGSIQPGTGININVTGKGAPHPDTTWLPVTQGVAPPLVYIPVSNSTSFRHVSVVGGSVCDVRYSHLAVNPDTLELYTDDDTYSWEAEAEGSHCFQWFQDLPRSSIPLDPPAPPPTRSPDITTRCVMKSPPDPDCPPDPNTYPQAYPFPFPPLLGTLLDCSNSIHKQQATATIDLADSGYRINMTQEDWNFTLNIYGTSTYPSRTTWTLTNHGTRLDMTLQGGCALWAPINNTIRLVKGWCDPPLLPLHMFVQRDQWVLESANKTGGVLPLACPQNMTLTGPANNITCRDDHTWANLQNITCKGAASGPPSAPPATVPPSPASSSVSWPVPDVVGVAVGVGVVSLLVGACAVLARRRLKFIQQHQARRKLIQAQAQAHAHEAGAQPWEQEGLPMHEPLLRWRHEQEQELEYEEAEDGHEQHQHELHVEGRPDPNQLPPDIDQPGMVRVDVLQAQVQAHEQAPVRAHEPMLQSCLDSESAGGVGEPPVAVPAPVVYLNAEAGPDPAPALVPVVVLQAPLDEPFDKSDCDTDMAMDTDMDMDMNMNMNMNMGLDVDTDSESDSDSDPT